MRESIDPILSPYQLGPHQFPGYWQYLFPPDVLAYRLPKERRASCAACPMIEARGFRPDYRCCTYLPFVPGFAVGLVMLEGKQRDLIKHLIERGFMTPEGLHPSPLARFHAKREDALGLYGKGESLCHLLDVKTGYCGIYAFRNGVCSTFFCIHDHGLLGEEFWGSLRDLACQLEVALHQWALRQLGFDLDDYIARLNQLADDPLGTSNAATRAWRQDVLDYLWGDWRHREQELFLETALLISTHRQDLFHLASKQRVLEPLEFEAALQNLINPEPEVDHDGVIKSGGALVQSHLELNHQLHDLLWTVPDAKSFLRLSTNVTIDQAAGLVRYQESDDYWELNIAPDEVRALLYFSVPRLLEKALNECSDLKNMGDPYGFISEYLANQVLEQLRG